MSDKPPKRKRSAWFAFYPDDFDGGTRSMSLAGRGAFLGLLSYQFANGSVPADDRTICRIIGAFPDEWEPIRNEVLSKFEKDGDGNLVNARMQKESEEREEIRSKRVDAINKRWKKPDTNVSDLNKRTGFKSNESVDTSPASAPASSPVPVAPNSLPEPEKMKTTSLPSSETYVESTATVQPEEGGKEDSSISLIEEKKHPFTEEMLLFIARRKEIPEDFARTLWLDLLSTDFVTANGTRLVSPASYLVACWERQRAKGSSGNPGEPRKRERWMIQKDLEAAKSEIQRIQSDKANRNHGGHGPNLADHKAEFEDAWLADLRKLRDAVKRELPAEWSKFEREHAEHVAAMIADKVPAEAMGEDYMLGRLSEAMPEEVPSFERWDREWNKPNAWKDPEKLTSEARTMVSQLKVHVERLEGELRGAMVAV